MTAVEERQLLAAAYARAPHLFLGPPSYVVGRGLFGLPVVHARDARAITKLTTDPSEAYWATMQHELVLPGFVKVLKKPEWFEDLDPRGPWDVYLREATPYTWRMRYGHDRQARKAYARLRRSLAEVIDNFDDAEMTQSDLAANIIEATRGPMQLIAPAMHASVAHAYKLRHVFIEDCFKAENWGVREDGEVVCFDAQASEPD